MPYTNKEEKAAYDKAYRAKNKERISAYKKEYQIKNKESLAANKKEYRANNKEIIASNLKEYYTNNKERLSAKSKVYSKTAKGKKVNAISTWKRCGVIGDLSKIYDERYLPSTHCEVCNKEYKCSRDKHLDHDHVSGKFRQILCCSCNILDSWKYKIIPKLSSGF